MRGGHKFVSSIARIIETTVKNYVGTVRRTTKYVQRVCESTQTLPTLTQNYALTNNLADCTKFAFQLLDITYNSLVWQALWWSMSLRYITRLKSLLFDVLPISTLARITSVRSFTSHSPYESMYISHNCRVSSMLLNYPLVSNINSIAIWDKSSTIPPQLREISKSSRPRGISSASLQVVNQSSAWPAMWESSFLSYSQTSISQPPTSSISDKHSPRHHALVTDKRDSARFREVNAHNAAVFKVAKRVAGNKDVFNLFDLSDLSANMVPGMYMLRTMFSCKSVPLPN